MSLFGEIGDKFFGGAEKDAAREEQKGLANASRNIANASEIARGEAKALIGGGMQDAQAGYQRANDIWQQLIPRQANIYQQGNVRGQGQVYSGLQQAMSALLGGKIDVAGLAPQTVPYNAQFDANLPALYNPAIDPAITGSGAIALQNMPPETAYIRGRLAAGEISYDEALEQLVTGRDYGQFTGIPRNLAIEFISEYK